MYKAVIDYLTNLCVLLDEEVNVEKSVLKQVKSKAKFQPDNNNQEINEDTEKFARGTSFTVKKKDDRKPSISATSNELVADDNKKSSPGETSTSGLGERAISFYGTLAKKSALPPTSSTTRDNKPKKTFEKPKSKACCLM